MLPKFANSHSAAGALVALAVGAGLSASQAQVSFYSAPTSPEVGVPRSAQVSESTPAPAPAAASEAPKEDTSKGGPSLGTGIFEKNPFTFTFAVREGFDDNVFTTKTDRKSSFYTNWAGGISYAFGSPRLQLTSSLTGGVTYYYTRPGDKVDFNGQYALNATYLATPRLTLTLDTITAYLSQPDLNIVGGTNRQNGDYLYSSSTLKGSYQWSEKFSTVTGYNISAVYYVEDALNDSQGRIEQTISQAFHWLVLPRTTAVAEYRANPITYFQADLNTFNQFFLVGVDQIFNPRFKWSARVGAQLGFDQNPDDGNDVYLGPYGESTLTYQFGPASSIAWLLRYGTEASGLTDVTQRQTFRTGLSLVHGFTPRISGTLGVSYQASYYDQSGVIDSFYENIFDVAVGLSFQVNRFIALQTGYQFTADVAPEATGREYTRNVVFVGANLSF